MEVGKLIHNVVDQKVNMTLSIKPFGCMPSSSVSDGVQSLITEMYPEAIFLPIETNGDGAVNVYSRVQMQLFKAKQAAEKSVETYLTEHGWTVETFKDAVQANPKLRSASHCSPHKGACTALDLAHEVSGPRSVSDIASKWLPSGKRRAHKQATLAKVHKVSSERQSQKAEQKLDPVKIVTPA